MNIKEPIQIMIHTDSLEMHEAFRSSMTTGSLERIGGMEFCVTSSESEGKTVKAHLQRFLKASPMKPSEGWKGEGLPPVGASCEFSYHKYPEMWRVGVIRYISKNTCVIEVGEAREVIEHPTTLKFRPIRTPEQIAEEERKSAVERMMCETDFKCSTEWAANICADLYDAGYRKFEIVEGE